MATAISPVRNRFGVASRLLRLSREMASERQTIGDAAVLRRDAEDQLAYFRKLRVRANADIDNTGSEDVH